MPGGAVFSPLTLQEDGDLCSGFGAVLVVRLAGLTLRISQHHGLKLRGLYLFEIIDTRIIFFFDDEGIIITM